MLTPDKINILIALMLDIQSNDDTTNEIHGLASEALEILDPTDD